MKKEELFKQTPLDFAEAASSLICSRDEGAFSPEGWRVFKELLSEPQIPVVMKYLSLKKYAPGEVIWKEGAQDASLALILSGRVSMMKETEIAGKQIVVGVYSPVTLVGEIDFVDGRPRPLTAKSLTSTEIVLLSRHNYGALAAELPNLGERIMKGLLQLLATRLRTSYERMAAIF
ncbi:MAG: cyclic nucleotide-binding domain-containing protein [Deltaproteobacteria bacterium]|nr:cyclic nucleotide-binding domain-containing protein [Deltaproteobacteria bacterium]